MAGVYRRESAWSISDLPLGGAPDESAGCGPDFTDIFDLWLIWLNAICPGAVEGPRMDRVLAIEAEASGKTPQQVRAQYTGGVSLRSFVTGDDIADTVLFLASPAAAKITGQAMTIDGHTESMV